MIQLADPKSLCVIVQTTNACQLKCPYCMAAKAKAELSREAVRQILTYVLGTIPPERQVMFVWHGGEPLIRGVAFYEWVYELQTALRPNGKVLNVLQTNGLLLSDAYLDFIQATGDFLPNISMDGPDEVTLASRGVSSDRYDEIFDRLRAKKIPFSVAVVASADVLKHKAAVIGFFEDRNIRDVSLVPFHDFGSLHGSDDRFLPVSGARPRPDVLARLALEDVQTAGGRPLFSILGKNLVRGMLGDVLDKGCTLSSFDGNCHARVVCVSADGTVYNCPRGQNVDLWKYGLVAEGGLEKWWSSTFGPPPFRPTLPTECESCKWKSICHGGCPANAKSMNGGADRRDYYCPSFVELFTSLSDWVDQEMENVLPPQPSRSERIDLTST